MTQLGMISETTHGPLVASINDRVTSIVGHLREAEGFCKRAAMGQDPKQLQMALHAAAHQVNRMQQFAWQLLKDLEKQTPDK